MLDKVMTGKDYGILILNNLKKEFADNNKNNVFYSEKFRSLATDGKSDSYKNRGLMFIAILDEFEKTGDMGICERNLSDQFFKVYEDNLSGFVDYWESEVKNGLSIPALPARMIANELLSQKYLGFGFVEYMYSFFIGDDQEAINRFESVIENPHLLGFNNFDGDTLNYAYNILYICWYCLTNSVMSDYSYKMNKGKFERSISNHANEFISRCNIHDISVPKYVTDQFKESMKSEARNKNNWWYWLLMLAIGFIIAIACQSC